MEPMAPYETWREGFFGKNIFRPLVYLFEHAVLPDAIFQRHPMAAELMDPGADPEFSLQHFLSASAAQCEIRGFWPPRSALEDGRTKYVVEIALELVSERDIRTNHDPLLHIQMPLPKAPGEARQVAILCGQHPQYFLEEVTEDPSVTMFCGRGQDRSHTNLGTHDPMTKSEFIALVRARTGAAAA